MSIQEEQAGGGQPCSDRGAHVGTSPQGASEAGESGLHSDLMQRCMVPARQNFPDRADAALWPCPSAFLFENDILCPWAPCTPR